MADFMKILQQAQEMQGRLQTMQDELAQKTVSAAAGGGMVTVKVSGELEVLELRIDPDAVDPEDVELLQDMVQAATNEALRSAQELAASKMGAVTGGLGGGPGGAAELRGGAHGTTVTSTTPAETVPLSAVERRRRSSSRPGDGPAR